MNLENTCQQAVDRLSSMEPQLVASRSGIAYQPGQGCFNLNFLNREYRVTFPGGKVYRQNGAAASLYLSIIMLHYLVTADGSPLSGNWISFRHLPGGDIYMEPFNKRALTPFLKAFGNQPEAFTRAAAALGGRAGGLSGISMVIQVMPRVPLAFSLWPGDEEFPAAANILIDERGSSYLPTEDYAHLPAIVTGEMKAALQDSAQ